MISATMTTHITIIAAAEPKGQLRDPWNCNAIKFPIEGRNADEILTLPDRIPYAA